MLRRLPVLGVLVLVCAVPGLIGAQDTNTPWMNWENAKALAAKSGRPIFVYSMLAGVDEKGGGGGC